MKLLGIILFSLIAINAAAETPCVYLGHDTIEEAIGCSEASPPQGAQTDLMNYFAAVPDIPAGPYYPLAQTSSLATYFVITRDAKNYGSRNINLYAPSYWYYYPIPLY